MGKSNIKTIVSIESDKYVTVDFGLYDSTMKCPYCEFTYEDRADNSFNENEKNSSHECSGKQPKLIPIKGMILCTNNPQRFTNAIVVETNKDETLILSDFGNLVPFKTDEVGEYYSVSENWKDAISWEYPLPSVLERIYKQMENLADVARHIRIKEGKGEN